MHGKEQTHYFIWTAHRVMSCIQIPTSYEISTRRTPVARRTKQRRMERYYRNRAHIQFQLK